MNFYVPYESPNKRYGFKVKWDQFGRGVKEDYYDITEETLIKKFEDTIALHQLHMRYAYIDNRIYARARANAHTFIKSQLCSTARLLVL